MTDATDTSSGRPTRQVIFAQLLLPLALVVMFLGFALVEPKVVSLANINNILTQASYLFIFSCAQMVVIITRGFDLSIGTNVSAVSVLIALVMTGVVGPEGEAMFWAVSLGVLTGLAFGALVGAFNGMVISWLRVNPFVTTLGSLNICLGVASMASDGRPVFNVPRPFSEIAYSGSILGIDLPIVYAVVVGLGMFLLLRHTVLGRSFYILGSNPRAAEVAGLPIRRYLTVAYVICGVLAAVGALLLTARTGSGEPNLGGGLRLVGESIAAAVIGGVSLRGGVGGVQSVIVGALFITVLSNGMNLVKVDGYIQMIVLGSVLVAAIVLDRIRTTRL